MWLEPGSTLSHYRLLEKVGEGGMGSVWRAHDTVLRRDVAIKILVTASASDRDRLTRFEREARILAALNHPSIVTVYSIEEIADCRLITMEYVEGTPLSRLIPDHGLPLDRLLAVAVPVTEAIGAAHRRGVIHRDIKPSNVLVGRAGIVKVLDFGLATLAEAAREGGNEHAAIRAGFSGTLAYMSPEHVQGLRVDQRSDIFSLGVVLYEMATGCRPFDAPDATGLIRAVLRDLPVPPVRRRPDLPESLDRLVVGCLEKDPSRRVASAHEIGLVLQRLASGLRRGDAWLDRSIAVLPFDDLSEKRDLGDFCDGVAEEILTALATVEGLRVASRPSSFALKAAGHDVREIGARLHVGALLDGSVRRIGDRLRITVELVDASDGFRLWSERYDRDLRDIFAIQDDIAHRVAEALQLTLSATEGRSAPRRHTLHVDAYDYYLRGRNYYYRYTRRGVEFARQLFFHAIEIDPRFARAHAGLADCSTYLYRYAGRDPTNLARAIAASRHAVDLDATLAEAHASLGAALSMAGEVDEAERAFRRAIQLSPDLFEARYFFARHLSVHRRLDEAAREYEEASRVRPEDYQAHLHVAPIYDDLGRPEQAGAARRRGLELAADHLKRSPDDARARYMGANSLVALGEREQGLVWANEALALEPDDPMLLFNVACVYSLAGDRARALDCLERSVLVGLAQRGWLEHERQLDAIRNEPRFRELMARIG